jgi:hypothetical protein
LRVPIEGARPPVQQLPSIPLGKRHGAAQCGIEKFCRSAKLFAEEQGLPEPDERIRLIAG